MIYIYIFIASLFFIYIGLKINNKIIGKVLVFIGLLIPCAVAGLRNYTVGTDTGGHILNLYKIAGNTFNFNDFQKKAELIYNCKDYIYLFLTYIFGHYNISFQLMLFLFESLIIFPIYFTLKKIKLDNSNIILGMTLFYLTIYNLSMNMIRQSIAIAFILLSFAIFTRRKNKKSILLSIVLFVIAVEFHDTAIYTLPVYIFYYILNNKKIKENYKTIIVAFIIIAALAFLIFHKPILTFIGNIGIYPKALWYLNRYSSFDIDFTGTLKNLLVVALIFYKRDFFKENGRNYKFGLLIAILNVILNFLGTFIMYSDRIAYYLFYLVIANYIALLTKKSTNNKILVIGILVIFIVYWIIVILINNGSQTLPYVMFK